MLSTQLKASLHTSKNPVFSYQIHVQFNGNIFLHPSTEIWKFYSYLFLCPPPLPLLLPRFPNFSIVNTVREMENFQGLDSGLGSSGFNLLSVTQTLLFLRRSHRPCSSCVGHTDLFLFCVGHTDLFLFVSVTQTLFLVSVRDLLQSETRFVAY